MESCGSTLDKNATDWTVMDVYDIAGDVGHEFERIIDEYGCESLLRLMPKVVRILEVLEVLVTHSRVSPEAEELRRELDRLQQERNDRCEKELKHQQELEQVEDMWRGEAQDLLSQVSQLQTENKRLLIRLSLKDSPSTVEDMQLQEGVSDRDEQVMQRLKDMVDKQKDDIRAKDRELMLRNEDIEALQLQQHRLMKINQDLRRRTSVVEAQGKALIQQKAQLEAEAQARQRELGAMRLEVARLREEQRVCELEREVREKEQVSHATLHTAASTSAKAACLVTAIADSSKQNSLWVECGGDPGISAASLQSQQSRFNEQDGGKEEDIGALSLEEWYVEEPEEEIQDGVQKDAENPCFTLQELQDVLQEKNELKAQVFMLEEELAYYKTVESDEEVDSPIFTPPPPSCPATVDQPESGIRRLISIFSKHPRCPQRSMWESEENVHSLLAQGENNLEIP